MGHEDQPPAYDGSERPSPIPPYAPQDGPPQYGPSPYGPSQYDGAAWGQGGQAQWGPQPPWGQPTAPSPPPYAAYGQVDHPKANTVKVLGILSIPTLFFCGLGLVLAVVTLVMAGGTQRAINASGGRFTGLSSVRTGQICAFVTIGLVVVGFASRIMAAATFAR